MDFPFDKYTYHARLLPVLIALIPLGLGLGVWFPGQTAVWKFTGAFFISFGLTALLSQLGRDLGKSKEPSLFKMWGGGPTTRMLSQRLSTLDPTTLKRYYAKLRVLLPDLNIPERSDEVRDPSAANQVYSSCVLFLRENTRDRKRFPLVYAENVNYGFRRNLWALKQVGIWSAALGAISCSLFVVLGIQAKPSTVLFGIVGALVSGVFLVLWLFVFNPNWIKLAANAYAERLLGSLDNM
jgi:hypothetical protein